jgi:hypothetical protein
MIPNTGMRAMNIIHPLDPVSLNLLVVTLSKGIKQPTHTIPQIEESTVSTPFTCRLFTIHAIRIGKPIRNKA